MKFFDAHKPSLADGDYTIEVNHGIGVKDYTGGSSNSLPISSSVQFTVNGPRYNLSPNDVHSLFPLEGSKGDFQNFLPYIVLNRSTLPWERKPFSLYDGDASWLFLLVLDESDLQSGQVKESTLMYNDIAANRNVLGIIDEANEIKLIDKKININLISLKDTSIIPSALDEIGFLSYVRIEDGIEQSVIVANRLPAPGCTSVVYLISLENKFESNTKTLIGKDFVYLKKWKFYTENEQLYSFGNGNYQQAILNDATLSTLLINDCASNETAYHSFTDFSHAILLPDKTLTDNQKKTLKHCCKLPGTTFHEILSNLKGKINYLADITQSDPIANTGATYLPWQHKDEQGFVVYDNAYYRGPLVTKQINLNFPENSAAKFKPKSNLHIKKSQIPVFADTSKGFIPADADELKITYNGNEDCTYAAAYELGKLTAINDKSFSSAFFEWKLNFVNQSLSQNQPDTQHLTVSNKVLNLDPNVSNLPLKLQAKFNDWKLLKGLPFRYLVPDPNFFPHESLRIFQVDSNWLNAFICGAFSIGYTPKSIDLNGELVKLFITENKWGFLLNSIAVKAWPDYELEVTAASQSIDIKRKDNLDASTQIYIFDKQFENLGFHLHEGKLLPGFMSENNQYWKHNKALDATLINGTNRTLNIASFLNMNIDINTWAKITPTLTPLSASVFNAWLMEGIPKVVFEIK